MKRIGILIFSLIMVFSMASCGNRVVVPNIEDEQQKISSTTANNPSKDYSDEEVPNNEIVVPDPPKAKEYLSGLWRDYDCTQTSVDVNGLQAIYSISVEQDSRFVDCTGTYSLILEYDDATGKWNELDDGWIDREYTFDMEGFKENSVWFVRPKPGSDGLYLYFGEVTATGCDIGWESMDDDLTINGEHYGEAHCTFKMGWLNGNDAYPCWALNGLEIEFNWNYFGGKYQTCTYYVQVQRDKINAPLDDPFGNTSGDAVVLRVND